MDLRTYEQRKFHLADIIRAAMALASSEQQPLQDYGRELLARLAEDRFNLVLVGRFNRGKSSLINALLGTERLQTGVVPVTSAITTVTYGSEERVLLRYEESGVPREIRLDELAAHVTQRGNPGNERRLKVAEVYLPVDVLRRGLFLVDTPGLGSAIAENTQTTEAFLPEADALLLVTSYESPLSDEEMRLLERAAASRCVVFVAVNKQDTLGSSARAEVLGYVEQRLRALFGGQSPRTFSISARDGLRARLERRPELLAESGISALQTTLLEFFLTDKANAVLARMAERIAELLHGLSATPEALQLLKELREPTVVVAEVDTREQTEPGRLERCAICESVVDVMFAFLSKYQYELSIEFAEQRQHAERGGFCGIHTWQYESIASPRGVALSYPALLQRLAQRLTSPDVGVPSVGSACRACAVRSRAESEAVVALATRLERDDTAGRPTLCLPHLVMAAGVVKDTLLRSRLLQRHADLLQRLAEDLQRFALRHDGLRRHLLSEEERNAPRQALAMVAGERSVSASVTLQ
jgi:small GTP-binding protein